MNTLDTRRCMSLWKVVCKFLENCIFRSSFVFYRNKWSKMKKRISSGKSWSVYHSKFSEYFFLRFHILCVCFMYFNELAILVFCRHDIYAIECRSNQNTLNLEDWKICIQLSSITGKFKRTYCKVGVEMTVSQKETPEEKKEEKNKVEKIPKTETWENLWKMDQRRIINGFIF